MLVPRNSIPAICMPILRQRHLFSYATQIRLCKFQTIHGHIFRISKVNTLFQAPLSERSYAEWLRHSVEAALQFFATPTTILSILYQMASHVARTTRRSVSPAVSWA